MKRAEIFRKIHEIEASCRHEHPDWPEQMAAWENSVKNNQPPWQVVRTEIDANNDSGQKHYRLEDGSILAAGYAPTKSPPSSRRSSRCKTVTAVRLELLNDPNLPLTGPGRSSTGLFALTEFHLEAAPADKPDQKTEVKIVARHGRRESARSACWSRSSTTGAAAAGSPGRSPLPSTARTRRPGASTPGPGRSNVPCKAVFVLEKPVSFPAGTILTFKLTQKHGGWNSDDNQNNNLGRFRFSVTDRPGRHGRPVPRNVREILAIPATQAHPGPDRRPSSATGGPPSPTGRRRTTRSKPSGSSIPRARRNWCSRIASNPRETHMLPARRFPQAGQTGRARRARVPQPASHRPAGKPPDVRPLAGRPPGADHGPVDRQPGLAGLFRHRDRQHQRGPGLAMRSRRRIPSCSTGWPSSSWKAAGASSICTA